MIFTGSNVINGTGERQRLEKCARVCPIIEGISVFEDLFESLTEGLGDVMLRQDTVRPAVTSYASNGMMNDVPHTR